MLYLAEFRKVIVTIELTQTLQIKKVLLKGIFEFEENMSSAIASTSHCINMHCTTVIARIKMKLLPAQRYAEK